MVFASVGVADAANVFTGHGCAKIISVAPRDIKMSMEKSGSKPEKVKIFRVRVFPGFFFS
jgi:hypothetical protein